MKKRTIALVVRSLEIPGGVPTVADFLRRRIERSPRFRLGTVVSLATASNDPSNASIRTPTSLLGPPTCREVEWQGVRCVHVGAWAGELEFQRFLPRSILRRWLASADVVQVVAGSPAWANAVAGCGRPVSLQVATLARVERRRLLSQARGARGAWTRLMTGITDRLDHRALRLVDAVQVENAWMRELAQRTCRPGALLDYAPPGVNTTLFRPVSRADVELGAGGYVLSVGRMADPRKNPTMLLEAYALLVERLRERAPGLVLAGATPLPASFWARADALGVRERVVFRASPSRDELIALYQHAACFVLSSAEEGFGVVIVEAMACGVPVVATRCGGPEGIVREGVNGYLVEVDDVDAMADRIARTIAEREVNLSLGAEARRRAHARFSEEATGQVFEDIWTRLCDGERDLSRRERP